MNRIIEGILFEGKRVPDAWDVSIWEKNGHREVSARQVIEWTEICMPNPPLDYLGNPLLDTEPLTPAEIAAAKEKTLKKAAQRAQTMCRRVIKAEGFNELLTITYRDNQDDRELAKKHFKEWVRRMKAALGGEFRYCASFEKQKRGAMHMHVACHKLPSHAQRKGVKIQGWRLGTDVWRSIVGADNGLVFVGGKKSAVKSRKSITRSPAKMAQYVSKYIMKDYAESPEEKNRYSRSNGTDLPKPVHVRLCGVSLADAIGAMFECADGDVVVSHRVGTWADSYWLCTEPDPSKLKYGHYAS
jgi:hypothetical protein